MKPKVIFISLLLTNCIAIEPTIEAWDESVVRYYIDSNLNQKETDMVIEAAEHISESTNMKFVRVYYLENYICHIKKNEAKINTSSSTTGKKKNCKVTLGLPSLLTIVHELGHTLGLHHEHQRPDRDEWITVNYDNIIKGHEHNFFVKHDHLYNIHHIPYDIKSVMHYHPYIFRKTGKITMTPVKDGIVIGPKTSALTELDIKKINAIYPADDTQWVETDDEEK